MISNVSMNNFRPSFGMARITETADKAADAFGIPKKDYGDLPLYHKKGIISEYMSKPSDYGDICHTYGCSDNGDANAKFVRTQVLSKQGDKAAAGIGIKAKDHAEIMRDLFIANFNNPKLKKADTLTLLNKAKSVLAPEEYTKYVGLLHDAK